MIMIAIFLSRSFLSSFFLWVRHVKQKIRCETIQVGKDTNEQKKTQKNHKYVEQRSMNIRTPKQTQTHLRI